MMIDNVIMVMRMLAIMIYDDDGDVGGVELMIISMMAMNVMRHSSIQTRRQDVFTCCIQL